MRGCCHGRVRPARTGGCSRPPKPSSASSQAIDDVAPLPPERVPLAAALGRALAEEVRADRPLPPFDNSQMDGYALRAADAPDAGARLPVAFEVFAGDDRGRPLPAGACARIFTGAPLPPGADCVEMQEEVGRSGKRARFRRAAIAGALRPARRGRRGPGRGGARRGARGGRRRHRPRRRAGAARNSRCSGGRAWASSPPATRSSPWGLPAPRPDLRVERPPAGRCLRRGRRGPGAPPARRRRPGVAAPVPLGGARPRRAGLHRRGVGRRPRPGAGRPRGLGRPPRLLAGGHAPRQAGRLRPLGRPWRSSGCPAIRPARSSPSSSSSVPRCGRWPGCAAAAGWCCGRGSGARRRSRRS